MAILNFQISTVGQVGVLPQWIYFQTDDTVSDVQVAGYLNKFVAEGNSISVLDMAVVSTIASPGVKPVCSLYQVSYSAGNWSLTIYGAGTGFDPASNYTTSGNWINNGTWQFTNSSFTLSGLGTAVTANVLYVGAGGLITKGAAPAAFNPAANYTVTGTWNFTNPSVSLSGLASATSANVVYYGAGGLLTYGAPPSFPNAYLVGGNALGAPGFLGSTTAQTLNIGTGGVNSISINGSTQAVTLNDALLYAPSLASVASLTGYTPLYIASSGGQIVYQTSAPAPATTFNVGGNSNLTGGAGSYLGSTNAEPLVVGTNDVDVLIISSSQAVAWGNVTTFAVNASTDIVLASPTVQLTGPSSVSPSGLFNVVVNGSGVVSFSNVANSGSGAAWDVGGNALSATGFLGSTTAQIVNIGTDSATAISIGSAGAISMPLLSVAPGGQKILMVDPTTFQLYISP